jgi:predicted PurR-regulated permease PerM
MDQQGQATHAISRCSRYSYVFMAGLGILTVWLHLATPLLAVLFAYLALRQLETRRRGGKVLAVVIFLVALAGIAYALGYFINQTVRALPEIGDQAIPAIIAWAKHYGIELPFTDYDSLKDFALDTLKSEVRFLGSFAKFARGASTQALFLAAGCVVAISLFLNPRFELKTGDDPAPGNLYSGCCREIAARFSTFYGSFVTVMGAQIIISAINSVLTAIFVLAFQLPYAVVIIGVTFLCGLVPVVGNLLSNTIVVAIGFTVSPKMALGALVFLVLVHKLEYFLNSKIVGWRIHNPLWLTLLGLIVGERLLGVPGMILAPVVLNYIRLEMSKITVHEGSTGTLPE